jgi:hypothetical protein
MEEFSSNFTQMFTSTRLCAVSMLPLCRLKIKVTLEGQKLTYKMFLDFNMYMNIIYQKVFIFHILISYI